MAEQDVRNIVEQWVEAWNSRDFVKLELLYDEDVVLYQAPVKKTLQGRNHMMNRLRDIAELGADLSLSVRNLHVVGETAILEFTETGTNTGRFLGHEPTGRRMDIDGCLVFRVKNGKIVHFTTYLDTATILRSVGLLTVPSVRPEAA